MGNGSPQKRWRENSQSRSLVVTVPAPRSLASSQPMMACLASAMSRPFRLTSSLALLMAGPSPTYALPSKEAGGCTVRTMGRPKFSANSQSRSSWPGTAMMAPVP
jgi:hypothetical protein